MKILKSLIIIIILLGIISCKKEENKILKPDSSTLKLQNIILNDNTLALSKNGMPNNIDNFENIGITGFSYGSYTTYTLVILEAYKKIKIVSDCKDVVQNIKKTIKDDKTTLIKLEVYNNVSKAKIIYTIKFCAI